MDDVLRFFGDRFADGKSLVLDKENATESSFRREAPLHRWVHLSTHGFYAPDISQMAQAATLKGRVSSSTFKSEMTEEQTPAIVHEGLKSGLALAGANKMNAEGEDDGILSAMEVSSMDLTGVEMAVLSACETGLGNSVSGEGVAGLQRAFQVAGARSTVTTLWPVSDVAARLLVARFYRNLWMGKMSKAAAMREAQQWMIAAAYKDDGDEKIDTGKLTIDSEVLPQTFRLPEYWAPFVLSGDWR
jgi:CHAT domain-containing protein